ncbi:hypothetical protein [Streptococcus loxodontisalivarius]
MNITIIAVVVTKATAMRANELDAIKKLAPMPTKSRAISPKTY